MLFTNHRSKHFQQNTLLNLLSYKAISNNQPAIQACIEHLPLENMNLSKGYLQRFPPKTYQQNKQHQTSSRVKGLHMISNAEIPWDQREVSWRIWLVTVS